MGSEKLNVSFAGSDVVTGLDRKYEDAAISDLARSRRVDDGLDSIVHEMLVDDEFNHEFGQERDAVFGPAIDSAVSLLTAVASDFLDRHA